MALRPTTWGGLTVPSRLTATIKTSLLKSYQSQQIYHNDVKSQ